MNTETHQSSNTSRVFTCKAHGHSHHYAVCHCGHQYCAKTWDACPRSGWAEHPIKATA